MNLLSEDLVSHVVVVRVSGKHDKVRVDQIAPIVEICPVHITQRSQANACARCEREVRRNKGLARDIGWFLLLHSEP